MPELSLTLLVLAVSWAGLFWWVGRRHILRDRLDHWFLRSWLLTNTLCVLFVVTYIVDIG